MDMYLPEAYGELFEPQITGTKYTYKVYYGGRDSCKSHSLARAILILGMQQQIRILGLREYYNSIKDSMKALLDDLIHEYNLEGFYNSTNTQIEGINGTRIIFSGLKVNNKNIKGKERIDIAVLDEGENISDESYDLLIPTIIRNPGAEIWIAFNPYLEDDPTYKRFITNKMYDSFVKKVSWRDNPFITLPTLKDIHYCRTHDYDKYLWLYEGECKKISDAAVFKGKLLVDNFKTPDDVSYYYGMDFGFKDPFAILRCYIDDKQRRIYIDKAARKHGLDHDDIPGFLDHFQKDIKRCKITADSARPDTISYLNRLKYKVKGAKKGKDSIIEGIEFIQGHTVVIHESLTDVIDEFTKYCYKTDPKTNEIKYPIKFQDGDDHYIDCLRYALEKVRNPIKLIGFA